MGLKDMLHSIREYPAVCSELEKARAELQQTRQALETSENDCESLWFASNEYQSANKKSIGK